MDINIKGLSTFFLFAIPAVLGLAALYWLWFGEGLHYFRRALSQEKRHAEIVGASPEPKAPIEIKLVDERSALLKIERAEIDGGDLWVYYRNIGDTPVRNIRLRWRLISPDGTVVRADDGYVSVYSQNDAPGELDAGQKGEARYRIKSDPRAKTIELYIH